MKQHLTPEEGFEVSLIDTLIVSYFKGFVKRFFPFFFRASSVGLEPLGSGPQPSTYSLVFPLDTLIISYFDKSVKYFINIFCSSFCTKICLLGCILEFRGGSN